MSSPAAALQHPAPASLTPALLRGLVGIEDGAVIAAWSMVVSDGVIQTIYGVTNPDKLAHISSTILPSFRPA